MIGLRLHFDSPFDSRGEERQWQTLQPTHDGATREHSPLHDGRLLSWRDLLRPSKDGGGDSVDTPVEPEQVSQVVYLVAWHMVSVDSLCHLWSTPGTMFAD